VSDFRVFKNILERS